MQSPLGAWQTQRHRQHVQAALRSMLKHGVFSQGPAACPPMGSLHEGYLPRAVVYDLLNAARELHASPEVDVLLLQLQLTTDGKLQSTYMLFIPATCPSEVPQHILTGTTSEQVWSPELWPDVYLDTPAKLRAWLEEITSRGDHSLYMHDNTSYDKAAHIFLG